MERIPFEDGLKLFSAPLQYLQELAQSVRHQKNPPQRVTFVLDTNPNYTNVCHVDCSFCAFYRHPQAKGAYTKSIEEVMQHLEKAQRAGLTTVLLQGGVNNDLKLEYFVNLVKEARARFPKIHPHFFSAIEIFNLTTLCDLSLKEILQTLWDAGLRTIPGGGAEILSERVRKKISPKKMTSDQWVELHHQAHLIGYRTTATMMFGHIEEPLDIMIHLEKLRELQDQTKGFTCFIPWSYKRENTALRRIVKHWAGPDAYFKILAIARIYLDNFDHIGASWFGEGKKIGIKALHYGADDFGGTIMEENVHRSTGWINKVDHNGMLQMIREAGFEPAQRDTLYQILRTYEGVDSVEIPQEQAVKEKDCLPSLESFQNR